jgi:hypothetical protein
MDAIDSLAGGSRRAEAAFGAAAQQLAAADLPAQGSPDPTNPVAPDPAAAGVPGVDVADQLVTMTVAADVHHATTAAMRSALSLYRDALDLLHD